MINMYKGISYFSPKIYMIQKALFDEVPFNFFGKTLFIHIPFTNLGYYIVVLKSYHIFLPKNIYDYKNVRMGIFILYKKHI